VLAPAGGAAPALWLLVARTGGLLGVWAAGRCAARLTPRAGRLPAAVVAIGVLAVAGLNFRLPGDGFLGSVWSGNSEGLLVACVLGAGLAGLDRRPGWAWALAVAAALLRPEAWPFALLLAAWLWRGHPTLRPWVLAGLVAVPVLWFGAELWGSGELFRGAARAQAITPDNPATTGQAARTVLSRARSYLPIGVQAAVLLGVVWSVVALVGRPRLGAERWRRRAGRASPAARAGRGRGGLAGNDEMADATHPTPPAVKPRSATGATGATGATDATRATHATTLAVGLFGAAWLVLVAVMAQARLASGNPRYVLLSIATAAVLAGVGVGRLVALAARRGRLAGVAVGVVALLVLVASALPQLRGTSRASDHLGYEARLDRDLGRAVTRVGGRDRALRCGAPVVGPLEVTALAWRLRLPIHRIGLDPGAGALVFRAAATLDDPPTPASTGGLAVLTAAGGWTVLGGCRAP